MHSDSWHLGYDDSDSVGGGGANGPRDHQREPLQAGPAFRPVSRSPAHPPDHNFSLQQGQPAISRQIPTDLTFDSLPSQFYAPQSTTPYVVPQTSQPTTHALLDYNPFFPYQNLTEAPVTASQNLSMFPPSQLSLPAYDADGIHEPSSRVPSQPQQTAVATDRELPLLSVTHTKSHRREFDPVVNSRNLGRA